jgi:MoaA/NifB/PqqE/SkfB family radical SAM enzyme
MISLLFKYGINYFKLKFAEKTGYAISKPTTVGLEITKKCNSRCIMCDAWMRNNEVSEIPLDVLKKRIDDLHRWLGRAHIQLGTGEPFMYKDIFKVVEYASQKGMIVGTVSNGLLINDNIAEKIVTKGFFNLNISLDGIKPETHNYTRGIPGAYDKVIEGIEKLMFYKLKYKSNIKIIIKPLIFKNNIDELIPLTEFVHKNRLGGINFQPFTPINNRCNEFIDVNLDKLASVINQLKQLKKNSYKIMNSPRQLDAYLEYFANPNIRPSQLDKVCSIGFKNIVITEGNKAFFCYKIPEVFNIDKYENLNKLWKSSEANAARKIIQKCGITCLESCLFKKTLKEQIDLAFLLLCKK